MIDIVNGLRRIAEEGYRFAGDAADEIERLRASLEVAETDAAHQKALADSALRVAEGWERKCDALRAKIEAMERQEPVGTLHDDGYFVWSVPSPYESNYAGWKTKLYALPGAKGEFEVRVTGAQPAPSASEDGLPERDSARPAEQQGLFRKFIVRRTDGSDAPGGKHYGCRYFALDVDHDKHAVAALTAYAKACETTHPELAKDLREKWGAQPAPSAPSEEAAAEMGANGGHVVEAERLAFEAWVRGHCWKLGAKWTGTEYRSDFEKGGMVDTHAMRTRELWAAWRDRAALAAAPEAKP